MAYDPLDPQSDPFRPPEISVEVSCLHCGQEYDSYLIEWRVETCSDGQKHGFWCCPTPGCDGRGFGFDILPTDPDYQDERGGWFNDDEDDEGEEIIDEDDEIDWDELDKMESDFDSPQTPDGGNGRKDADQSGPSDEDIPF
jgi:hypothetical protein